MSSAKLMFIPPNVNITQSPKSNGRAILACQTFYIIKELRFYFISFLRQGLAIVVQGSFEFEILLPQLPECYDDRFAI